MTSLVALILCLHLAGDTAVVPLRAAHPWGRWQPGAWVEMETRVADSAPAVVDRSQLLRAAAEGYVLQLSVEGQGAELQERTASWSAGGFAHLAPEGVVLGQEDVEVAGRSFRCTVWEARTGEPDAPRFDRCWVADGIELPLRFQSSAAQISVSMTVASLEDYVEVDGRKLRCLRFEGSGKARDGAFQSRQWMSLEVPGGIVRLETLVKAGGQPRRIERQVLAFRGDPRRR